MNDLKHATALYFQLTKDDSVYKNVVFKMLDDLPNYDNQELAIYIIEHVIKVTLTVHMPSTSKEHFDSYQCLCKTYKDAVGYLNRLFRCIESGTNQDYPRIKYE